MYTTRAAMKEYVSNPGNESLMIERREEIEYLSKDPTWASVEDTEVLDIAVSCNKICLVRVGL